MGWIFLCSNTHQQMGRLFSILKEIMYIFPYHNKTVFFFMGYQQSTHYKSIPAFLVFFNNLAEFFFKLSGLVFCRLRVFARF